MAAVHDAPLTDSLGVLVGMATTALGDGVRAAFYLAADGGAVRLRHIVGMPDEYAKAVDGTEIGPDSLAFGLARHRGEPVITADVHTDPHWEPWRWMADRFGYRGCWSFPIPSGTGTFIGTLALYWPKPRAATDRELELASLLTNTAAIIISRYREAQDRKHAEDALRSNDARYRALFESIDEGFLMAEVIYDAADRPIDALYLEANPAASRLTGVADYSRRRWSEASPGAEPDWLEIYDRVARTGVAERLERCAQPLGRWYAYYVSRVTGGTHDETQDRARRVAVVFQDITERKRAEVALRVSEERLRTVMDSIEDYAFFTLDSEGRVTSWSEGARRITGYETDEVLGQPVAMFYTPDDVAHGKPARELATAAAAGRSQDESWRVRKDGSRVWVSEIVRPIGSGDGRTVGFAKISRDLTERKAFEDALQQAHDSLEQRVRGRTSEVVSLFQRLVSAQEEERRRIARDIHDQLGQQMTALRMNLEVLAGQVDHDAAVVAQAARTQRLAEELDHSIDFLTWDLRPAALDHLGLAVALEELVTGWSERFGITAEFDAGRTESLRLSRDKEVNIYRLAQEALHNVVKHAQATHVTASLQRRGGDLLFVLEDNGRGFALEESQPRAGSGGLGLVSMQERAALIGGVITIESEPGRGTTIFVRVPIASADQGNA
jgi:PAS domain S-box-containing protein